MSSLQKFVEDEDSLAAGPKFELRSGGKPRNETDIDLLPPVVPGWPTIKRSDKEQNSAQVKDSNLAYRETLIESPVSANTERQPNSESENNVTENFVDAELESSFKNLNMSTDKTFVFKRDTEPLNSNEHDQHAQQTDDWRKTELKQQASYQTGFNEMSSCLENLGSKNATTSEDKEEEMDEKKVFAVAKSIFSVSDAVIAPKPFTGTDAESWLEFFELYCKHRGLKPAEQLTLFPLMMRDGAADWLATQSRNALRSYANLVAAFKDNYFVPVELHWQQTGLLWNQNQKETETVEEFVTRVRRGARRINLADTQLEGIILNGLRPTIRMHVLQKGGDTLNDLIKTAKLAEAIAPQSNDSTNELLIKYIQASVQANEKQSKEMQKLTSKIAALTGHNDQTEVYAVELNQTSFRPQRRFVKPTPQNQQRNNTLGITTRESNKVTLLDSPQEEGSTITLTNPNVTDADCIM